MPPSVDHETLSSSAWGTGIDVDSIQTRETSDTGPHTPLGQCSSGPRQWCLYLSSKQCKGRQCMYLGRIAADRRARRNTTIDDAWIHRRFFLVLSRDAADRQSVTPKRHKLFRNRNGLFEGLAYQVKHATPDFPGYPYRSQPIGAQARNRIAILFLSSFLIVPPPPRWRLANISKIWSLGSIPDSKGTVAFCGGFVFFGSNVGRGAVNSRHCDSRESIS
ncbi:hypothetical protein LY78DRAFT_145325 [Colletotrichum sublineola]|nr:hypothetical protein LY78DRAFT_145325 [Colletotrichum sublineola]